MKYPGKVGNMKKIILFLFAAVLIFSGCGLRNESRVESPVNDSNTSKDVHIVNITVNHEGDKITDFEAELENMSDIDYEYGYKYHLEVYQNGGWYIYKNKEAEAFIFEMLSFPLPAGETRTGNYDYLYQKSLSSGQYRFVTEVLPTKSLKPEYVVFKFEE